MTITEMLERSAAANAARGLRVRCPTCNAGRGKFCLRDGVTVHRSADDIVVHEARVELARAEGLLEPEPPTI